MAVGLEPDDLVIAVRAIDHSPLRIERYGIRPEQRDPSLPVVQAAFRVRIIFSRKTLYARNTDALPTSGLHL